MHAGSTHNPADDQFKDPGNTGPRLHHSQSKQAGPSIDDVLGVEYPSQPLIHDGLDWPEGKVHPNISQCIRLTRDTNLDPKALLLDWPQNWTRDSKFARVIVMHNAGKCKDEPYTLGKAQKMPEPPGKPFLFNTYRRMQRQIKSCGKQLLDSVSAADDE